MAMMGLPNLTLLHEVGEVDGDDGLARLCPVFQRFGWSAWLKFCG